MSATESTEAQKLGVVPVDTLREMTFEWLKNERERVAQIGGSQRIRIEIGGDRHGKCELIGYEQPPGLVAALSLQGILVVKWKGGSYWRSLGSRGYQPAQFAVYQVVEVRPDTSPDFVVAVVRRVIEFDAAGPSLSGL